MYQPSTRPNIERLERACQIVEQRATKRNFDLTRWCGYEESCGFVGCFGGHLVDSGEFPQLHFDGNTIVYGESKQLGVTSVAALADFFNISYDDAMELFTPAYYIYHDDPKSVIQRVRNFIATYKNEHMLEDA